MKRRIDLNADLGEYHPKTGENYDNLILPFLSSCNVCCGFHSGSAALANQTIVQAIEHNVALGAHPSYNDRANFGRQSSDVNPMVLKAELLYQIGAIKTQVESHGQRLHHVKPHGALYNDMAQDEKKAQVFIDVIQSIDPHLKVYGLAGSPFENWVKEAGLNFVNECFADRAYTSELMLKSRSLEGAVLHEKSDIQNRIESLLHNNVIDEEGNRRSINAESICLHGDTEGAVALAEFIHNIIVEYGVKVLSPE